VVGQRAPSERNFQGCDGVRYDGAAVRIDTLLLVLGVGSAVGLGGGVVAHQLLPESPLVRGLHVGERRLPEGGPTAAQWLSERSAAMGSRVVRLRFEDRVFESTLAELGVHVDVVATLQAAEAVGHEGAIWRRVREARRARRGEIDVPLVWAVDRDKARAVLARIAPELRTQPVDARLDLAQRTKIPDRAGRELDVEASLERIVTGSHDDEEVIYLLVRGVNAKVTVDDLIRVDVDRLLSAHETTFVTWGSGQGRATNIRMAASRIDGIVLQPGEELSFNEHVGPRTVEAGFTMAPEIQGDETVTGVGGGTCQVSSTLHAAALYGALEVLERQGHSRPSAYAAMGLDATVAFGKVDLRIKNTMSFPILIHAYLPKETAVRVEILGGDPVAEVVYRYGVGHTEDFTRRIYVKNYLAPGRRIRHQKGSRGFDVTSVVTYRFPDGRVEERKYFSGYRPAPEIFWVAPGYDEQELPPLPDHAKGVEGRMTKNEGETDAESYL
jgi:vancomycin resistance protein YoaR